MRSDELEQEVLDGFQAPAGLPQSSISVQLSGQDEQLPLLSQSVQRQGFLQLRHAHGVRLILKQEEKELSGQKLCCFFFKGEYFAAYI